MELPRCSNGWSGIAWWSQGATRAASDFLTVRPMDVKLRFTDRALVHIVLAEDQHHMPVVQSLTPGIGTPLAQLVLLHAKRALDSIYDTQALS